MKVLNSCNVHAADSGQASTISAASSSEEGARHIFNPTRAFALGALHMRGTWGRASSFSFFKGNKMTPDINLSHLTPATRTVPASVFGEHLAGERDCLGYQVETLPAFARARIPVLNPCHFFNEAHYRTLAAWWTHARRVVEPRSS